MGVGVVGGGGEEGRGEGDEEDVREKGKEVVKQGKDGWWVWRDVGFWGRGNGEERWRRGEDLERRCRHDRRRSRSFLFYFCIVLSFRR